MRLHPFLLTLALLVASGCAGAGSHPVRSAPQKAALKAIETVFPIYRKGASGPHRSAPRKARSLEPEYNQYYKLWMTTEEEGRTTTTFYWSDAAATKPAGSNILTISGEGFPYTHTYEETVTAGPMRGMHRVGSQTFAEDGSTSHEVATYRDGYTVVSTDYQNDDGSSGTTLETTDKDGFRFTTTIIQRSDRTSTRVAEIDAFKATFDASSDFYTGTGSVVAKNPLESATFEATAVEDGEQRFRTLTVHYADGSTETFGPEPIPFGP
jgi:hypothetical protein